MKTLTRQWSSVDGWSEELPSSQPGTLGTLVLSFWSAKTDASRAIADLEAALPGAVIVGCSTAGHIVGSEVTDVDFVATIVEFKATEVFASMVTLNDRDESRDAGLRLGKNLLAHHDEPPQAVLVLTDGLGVDGSHLSGGLTVALPPGVPVSGGLAGDGALFEETFVCLNSEIKSSAVVGIGLWGDDLVVNHGVAGGWQPFGPQRIITKSEGSELLELDGQPALELYQRYLGDHADELPGSGLLFPLQISSPDGKQNLVRGVNDIDKERKSMRFAGDIPVGWSAQLMRTSIDRLVDGAVSAANQSLLDPAEDGTLAFAVSCVGRRLVLRERAGEEIEACLQVLGDRVTLRGFYSYGEIAPVDGYVGLHNQTMTLTTIAERAP